MTTLNLSPLFRTAIGFDRLARLMDSAAVDVAYPPYNIEKTGEDSYAITMAVAGFGPEDIEVTVMPVTSSPRPTVITLTAPTRWRIALRKSAEETSRSSLMISAELMEFSAF